jgi:hypothetical protein
MVEDKTDIEPVVSPELDVGTFMGMNMGKERQRTPENLREC